MVGAELNVQGSVSLHVVTSEDIQTARLDDGSEIPVDGTSVARMFPLSNWTLVAERWEAPKNMSHASIHHHQQAEHHPRPTGDCILGLAAALANAPGVGYYTTTFKWPPKGKCGQSKADGAYLNVGRVAHAVRVVVNGEETPPVDFFKGEMDISQYLRVGENEVLVIAPTTMWNYLLGLLPEIKTAGSTPLPLVMGLPLVPMETGLLGPVTVTPFKSLVLEG